MGAALPTPRGRDLDTTDEVGAFVTCFYRDVAQDDLLGPYFNQIARVDWPTHVATLTDFWSSVLLGTERNGGDPIEAHRWLHAHTPMGPEHFERWLEIFTTTVDAGWRGPLATLAKRRAHGMAWAIARRLGVATGAPPWAPIATVAAGGAPAEVVAAGPALSPAGPGPA